MKLFRLRFVLLGLLLCVCHVWSLSCRTEFDDPASKAYQSEIVIIGKVEQILPPVNSVYNVTVKVKNKRDIYKGEKFLKKGKRSRVGRLTVGQFGPEDIDQCIASVKQDAQYFFFLNSTSDSMYLTNSRMAVSTENSRTFKKAKKDIKKILKCKSGKCVKLPVVDSRRALKDKSIAFGKTIELNCRIKRSTLPQALFQWYKDGLEIKHKSVKGLSIKTGKKGSRLKKSKAGLRDAGTYVCIAKNVGGEIKQQSVISITGVQGPTASRKMKDKKQKFGGTLKLTCRVKGDTTPKPKFHWLKDGKEIKNGDKPLLSIKNRGSESRLRKDRADLSDGGRYECVAENIKGKEIQTSVVTITDAPQKTRPCDEKDKHYCLNNGTCNVMVELDQKFCTCPRNYQGSRCDTFVIGPDVVKKIKDGEQKLAQDRTIIVVAIISGILLFIAICVASYFLAKRRHDQFTQRRRANGRTVEDNIPSNKRCDDKMGLRKYTSGVIINRETQTIETCFLAGAQEDARLNLYINPLEGYVRPNREERNSRSRLTAVSLEGAPKSSAPNSLERPNNSSHANKNGHLNNSPDRPNSKRVPSERENSQPNGARVRAENSGSLNPPALNLDTDSEDENISEETPLTPLHISEDEDTLRRKREKQYNATNDRNFSKFPYPRDSSNDSNYSKPPSYTTALESDKPDTYLPEKVDRSDSDDRLYASSSPGSSESSSTTEGCDSPNSRALYDNEFSISDPALHTPSNWSESGHQKPHHGNPPPFSVPKYDYIPLYANNNNRRAPIKQNKLGNFNKSGEIAL